MLQMWMNASGSHRVIIFVSTTSEITHVSATTVSSCTDSPTVPVRMHTASSIAVINAYYVVIFKRICLQTFFCFFPFVLLTRS